MLALTLTTALLLATAPAAPAREALPFLADDYPRALELARMKNVPLFIEAWAPW